VSFNSNSHFGELNLDNPVGSDGNSGRKGSAVQYLAVSVGGGQFTPLDHHRRVRFGAGAG
jgi:hypothetical protein